MTKVSQDKWTVVRTIEASGFSSDPDWASSNNVKEATAAGRYFIDPSSDNSLYVYSFELLDGVNNVMSVDDTTTLTVVRLMHIDPDDRPTKIVQEEDSVTITGANVVDSNDNFVLPIFVTFRVVDFSTPLSPVTIRLLVSLR